MDIFDIRQLIINNLFIPNKLLLKICNKDYYNYLSRDDGIIEYNNYKLYYKPNNKYIKIVDYLLNNYNKIVEEYIIRNDLDELTQNAILNKLHKTNNIKILKLLCEKISDYQKKYVLSRLCRLNGNIELIKYLYNFDIKYNTTTHILYSISKNDNNELFNYLILKNNNNIKIILYNCYKQKNVMAIKKVLSIYNVNIDEIIDYIYDIEKEDINNIDKNDIMKIMI